MLGCYTGPAMRLLLVEDDKLLAKSLEQQLRHRFAIDVVSRYRQAMHQLRTQPYAILVVDWTLPDGEGPELCRSVRREQLTLPILMLTGRNEVADCVMGLNSGADDYLTKPFNPQELLARLQALLRRQPNLNPSSKLTFGPLTLISDQAQLASQDQRISLSRIEFLILELLFRHPAQVITKTTFWDQVWDYHHEPTSNSLEVHVKNLRQKIKQLTPLVKLTTIKGWGYSLELVEQPRPTSGV